MKSALSWTFVIAVITLIAFVGGAPMVVAAVMSGQERSVERLVVAGYVARFGALLVGALLTYLVVTRGGYRIDLRGWILFLVLGLVLPSAQGSLASVLVASIGWFIVLWRREKQLAEPSLRAVNT